VRSTKTSQIRSPTVLVMSTPMVLNTNFDLLHEILTKIATDCDKYSIPLVRAQTTTGRDVFCEKSSHASSSVHFDGNSSTSGSSFDADATESMTSQGSFDPDIHTSSNATEKTFDPETMTPRTMAPRTMTPRSLTQSFDPSAAHENQTETSFGVLGCNAFCPLCIPVSEPFFDITS